MSASIEFCNDKENVYLFFLKKKQLACRTFISHLFGGLILWSSTFISPSGMLLMICSIIRSDCRNSPIRTLYLFTEKKINFERLLFFVIVMFLSLFFVLIVKKTKTFRNSNRLSLRVYRNRFRRKRRTVASSSSPILFRNPAT